MSDNHSRLNKYEKRRKNTKTISILFIIGSILLVFLIGLLIFGGEDSAEKNPENKTTELTIQESEPADEEKEEDMSDSEETDEEDEDAETVKKNAKPSDDNVIEAYTADWNPVGTEQEGEHTTQFKKDSTDWNEMEYAASVATEINENDMVTWWIEGAGEQQAIATVSDSKESQSYRVFLTWVDNEGWKPTKVEVLKENDKKNN